MSQKRSNADGFKEINWLIVSRNICAKYKINVAFPHFFEWIKLPIFRTILVITWNFNLIFHSIKFILNPLWLQLQILSPKTFGIYNSEINDFGVNVTIRYHQITCQCYGSFEVSRWRTARIRSLQNRICFVCSQVASKIGNFSCRGDRYSAGDLSAPWDATSKPSTIPQKSKRLWKVSIDVKRHQQL